MSLNSTSAKHDLPLQLCFISLLRTRRPYCCAVHEHSRTRTQALHVIGQNIRLFRSPLKPAKHGLNGPVLAIMLCAPLLLFWFSRERGVHCY